MRKLMMLGLPALLLAACGGGNDGGAIEHDAVTSPSDETSIAPANSNPVESQAETAAPSPDSVAPVPEPTPITEETTPGSEDSAGASRTSPLAELALGDLAGRLDVDSAAIGVVVVEAVTWRDGSIGCPEPGMSYTQALVPGTRIILEYAGSQYNYHATDRRDPFYCAAPTEPLSTDDLGSPDL